MVKVYEKPEDGAVSQSAKEDEAGFDGPVCNKLLYKYLAPPYRSNSTSLQLLSSSLTCW